MSLTEERRRKVERLKGRKERNRALVQLKRPLRKSLRNSELYKTFLLIFNVSFTNNLAHFRRENWILFIASLFVYVYDCLCDWMSVCLSVRLFNCFYAFMMKARRISICRKTRSLSINWAFFVYVCSSIKMNKKREIVWSQSSFDSESNCTLKLSHPPFFHFSSQKAK